MIYLDLEADGLNPTQIWCVVTMENGHPTVHTTPDTLSEALRSSVSVVGHNLIGYDIPVLERLWGLSVASERIVDTLVLSRLCDPSKSGGHSLRNWGNELGFPKGDHDDWTQLSQEMIDYCIQDVKVTEAVHQKLKRRCRTSPLSPSVWNTKSSVSCSSRNAMGGFWINNWHMNCVQHLRRE